MKTERELDGFTKFFQQFTIVCWPVKKAQKVKKVKVVFS